MKHDIKDLEIKVSINISRSGAGSKNQKWTTQTQFWSRDQPFDFNSHVYIFYKTPLISLWLTGINHGSILLEYSKRVRIPVKYRITAILLGHSFLYRDKI